MEFFGQSLVLRAKNTLCKKGSEKKTYHHSPFSFSVLVGEEKLRDKSIIKEANHLCGPYLIDVMNLRGAIKKSL